MSHSSFSHLFLHLLLKTFISNLPAFTSSINLLISIFLFLINFPLFLNRLLARVFLISYRIKYFFFLLFFLAKYLLILACRSFLVYTRSYSNCDGKSPALLESFSCSIWSVSWIFWITLFKFVGVFWISWFKVEYNFEKYFIECHCRDIDFKAWNWSPFFEALLTSLRVSSMEGTSLGFELSSKIMLFDLNIFLEDWDPFFCKSDPNTSHSYFQMGFYWNSLP